MAPAANDTEPTDIPPVVHLIDALRQDDSSSRLMGVKALPDIALALGDDRTRKELVPFLTAEVIDDDDEVLLALADSLVKLLPYVGGADFVHTLLPPFEELCLVEETVVRNKAVDSLKILLEDAKDSDVGYFKSLVVRLATHEWFQPRTSAVMLLPPVLKRVSVADQRELLPMLERLGNDDTPMVRRAAASSLTDILEALQHLPERGQILKENVLALAQDEQESVRIFTVPTTLALMKLDNFEIDAFKLFAACAKDKSWRVKFILADHLPEILKTVPAEERRRYIEEIYFPLLRGDETDPKINAIEKLELVVGAILTPPNVVTVKEVLEGFTKALNNTSSSASGVGAATALDLNSHVRLALAGSLLKVAGILPSELFVEFVVPRVLEILRDDHPSPKLKLLAGLSEMPEKSNDESLLPSLLPTLIPSLLPALQDLANDRQWRVRLAILDFTPLLAKHLGKQVFMDQLWKSILPFVGDPVWRVREAAVVNFVNLTATLGVEWAEENILSTLHSLTIHHNYLLRCTGVNAAARLVKEFPPEKSKQVLLPLFLPKLDDEVPNVRFNVAKAISVATKYAEEQGWGKEFNTLVGKKLGDAVGDADTDVKFFAKEALAIQNGESVAVC